MNVAVWRCGRSSHSIESRSSSTAKWRQLAKKLFDEVIPSGSTDSKFVMCVKSRRLGQLGLWREEDLPNCPGKR
jgi:hypothetical protein